jgi:hypothetical protein
MKSKVPILVDKMTAFNPLSGRIQGAENGASGPTIASANAPSDASSPILLLVPSGRDKRDARWAERLRAVAQVHIVHSHQSLSQIKFIFLFHPDTYIFFSELASKSSSFGLSLSISKHGTFPD